jgi:phosphatidylserine decarboxylase
MRNLIARFVANEELNFLLTNRIPRRLATRAIGWFSKIEQPFVARTSIAVWRQFSDVDLADAEDTHYPSMHACFTRQLKAGARHFDTRPNVVASPSDAIVGATGRIEAGEALQIKGAPYRIADLVGSETLANELEGSRYVTLRLTAGMYHRFHAPADLVVERLTYLSGDCFNVNTPALKRVQALFCRNERAVLHCRLGDGSPLLLVAVAAILVASIRLTFFDTPGLLRDGGSRSTPLDIPLERGSEMGWFEHGSTIIAIAPGDMQLANLVTGDRIRAGQVLLTR